MCGGVAIIETKPSGRAVFSDLVFPVGGKVDEVEDFEGVGGGDGCDSVGRVCVLLIPLVDIPLEDGLSGTTRSCGLNSNGSPWCDSSVVRAGSVFRVEGSVFVAENDLTVSGGEVVEFGGAASFDLHTSNVGGDVGVGDGGECGSDGDGVVSGAS